MVRLSGPGEVNWKLMLLSLLYAEICGGQPTKKSCAPAQTAVNLTFSARVCWRSSGHREARTVKSIAERKGAESSLPLRNCVLRARPKQTPGLPLSMQKLVVILGTNASGKSDLGIRVAKHFGGEVVSADSRQVYRGLDLGTGKITAAQAGTVKHHLIDVADLSEYFSLAQYQRAAYSAIDSIAGAGKLPIIVGGTGLYISAIVEGYQLVDVPPNDPLRTELEGLPLAQLVERLEKSNPGAASLIDQSNRRRLIRAIEIASAGHAHSATHISSPRYNCLQLGLIWPREVLEERIEKRLRERLGSGMIDEVAGLRSQGVSDTRLDKLGLEYRFITRYLRGELGTLDDLRLQLGIAIRQFAKAQLTWFKRDSRIIDKKLLFWGPPCT